MCAKKRTVAVLLLVIMVLSLAPTAMAASGQYTGKTTSKVYFRTSPSTTSNWIAKIPKGTNVTLLAVKGDFYVAFYLDRIGYIAKNYVSVSSSAQKALAKVKMTTAANDSAMKGIKSVSDITVPATSRPGHSGKNIKALQQALKIKGFYLFPVNSTYDEHTVQAVKAFQKVNKLTVDGIAGNETIKKLFGKPAANAQSVKTVAPAASAPAATQTSGEYKTEALQWFNDGKNLFSRGNIISVKDVQTGRVWKCRVLYTGNHLDVEPLTKEDTRNMVAAYGGNITYKRRAVLVKFNGHVYAGSMYGEPHGDQSIKNNGFDGQFCIHFSGSMTSQTKRVDKDHQNAILQALKHKW